MSNSKQKKEIKTIEKVRPNKKVIASPEDLPVTYLHCQYVTSPEYIGGWWVNINESSFIINSLTHERLKLISAIGIPFFPERHYLKKFGDSLCFTLIFPKIPKDWMVFDFVECTSDMANLSSKGIVRNDSGIYKIIVS